MTEKPYPHPSVFLGEKRLERIKGYRVHESRTPDNPVRIVTPSQTLGPFFALGLAEGSETDVARRNPDSPAPQGEPIAIAGRVTDEDGRPVRKALLEVWQANRWGKYDHPDDITDAPLDPNFKGWGRMLTDADGSYRFRTIKPGAYPNPGYDNWMRPPHIHFSVFAAGLMQRLITQLYFPGEPLNDLDPILNGIENLDARASLVARSTDPTADGIEYRFDIVLRGRGETAFFVDA
jgi:protocatechuate 3,4-dioxygenase beta subunit